MALLIRSNLRQLIMVLALLSTLVTVINMFLASSEVQKQALIETTLQHNQAYATKLADSTQLYLENIQLELAYSAEGIARNWQNKTYLKKEILRLSKQNTVFNALVLVNTHGIIINSSNNAIELVGLPLTTAGTVESLKIREPLISQPYESALNNLVIMISQPIFNEDGTYLGFVGGTIYLKEKNILNRLLGEHYYKDGSYIYVVDQEKRLLYHPKSERLGSAVLSNPLIDLAINGEAGHAQITNSEGIEMLSGYAHIPAANWGVISQRPLKITLEAHEGLMEKIVFKSLPINLGMLALIWLCAWLISAPLRQLAVNAKNMRQASTIKRIQNVRAWYFEANELKNAFLFGLQNIHDHVGQLRQDVRTDPLTGLYNRRALDYILKKCELNQTPFTVISIDIDHFKRVNDTFGHDIGDSALKELAKLMKSISRDDDFCLRVGGEEFLIFLPDSTLETATDIAERLRLTVEMHSFPTVGNLTISLGVAQWPLHGEEQAAVLKCADDMLYAAKQGGRNQTQIAPIPSILR